jgi:hypothetical protein
MGARYSLAVGIWVDCYTCMSTCLWPSGYLTVMGETHNHILVPGTSLFLIVITILLVPNHSIQRKTHRPKAPITSLPSLGHIELQHRPHRLNGDGRPRKFGTEAERKDYRRSDQEARHSCMSVYLSAWTSFPPTATATA